VVQGVGPKFKPQYCKKKKKKKKAFKKNRQDQKRTSPCHITVKKERILKGTREKHQVKYKGKPVKITYF
jgi:hypothetical protein